MGKVYVVDLSDEEKARLLELTKKGKSSARKLKRAHILLMANEGATDTAIGKALHVSVTTVERIRKRFVEGTRFQSVLVGEFGGGEQGQRGLDIRRGL